MDITSEEDGVLEFDLPKTMIVELSLEAEEKGLTFEGYIVEILGKVMEFRKRYPEEYREFMKKHLKDNDQN